MLIILIQVILAQDFSLIPSTGAPPEKTTRLESVYDPITNEILTFGGFNPKLNTYSSLLNAFSLTNQTWRKIKSQSILIPPGLCYSKLFLTPERKLLAFFGQTASGLSSDVYSYNLNTDSWAVEPLKGDGISGVSFYALTSFTYNNTVFIAFFGGVTKDGVNNNLFLMNVTSRVVRKIVNKGVVPNPKVGSSIVYYNESLFLYGLSWPGVIQDLNVSIFHLKNETWGIFKVPGAKPMPRYNHFAYIYKDGMYVIYGTTNTITLSEIWLLNLTTSNWKLLSNETQNFRFLSGSVQVDNRVYLLLGRNEFDIFNSIEAYDFDAASARRLMITENWESPPARKNHCSLTISDKIYIFGGMSDSGKYLNDIWSYDTTLNAWSEVLAFGATPSPKESFACAKTIGSTFAVFGGRDDVSIFDEFHYFDLISHTWFEIVPKGERPKERAKACMCVKDFMVFIIGGQNNQGTFDDLWVYDYVKNRFTELTVEESLSFQLYDHKCWITSNVSDYSVYVLGGSTNSFSQNPILYKISLARTSSTVEFKNTTELISSTLLGISETEVILSGDYIYLVFGTKNSYVIPLITCLNYKTLEITYTTFPDSIATYGHSSAHYRSTFYIFGGILGVNKLKVFTLPTNKFLKISKSQNSLLNIPCSAGTISPDCQPCTKGYTYIEGKCEPCPAGRYSVSIAAVGVSECLPCQFGTYSPELGTTYCYDCPANVYCPVGASKQYHIAPIKKYQNNQPAAYQANTTILLLIIGASWYAVLFTASLTTILVLCSRKISDKFKMIDIFVGQHEQKLNMPVIFRRNTIGGVFSMVFIVMAIFIFIINVLTLEIDNVVESRSLVPIATLSDSVSAKTFEVNVMYDLYGGDCVNGQECSTFTVIDETGFDFTEKLMKCEWISENCLVKVKYSGFSMVSSSTISISMTEITSYSTGLTVNISVSSSVPDQNSNVFIPLYPDSQEKLFRGQVPTIIKYEANPSVIFSKVFHSENGDTNTGYHITNTETKIGSTVTALTVLTTAFVLIEINIDIANTGFVIERQLSNSWFIFLGNTLGSVFGIFGTFAAVMNLLENLAGKYKDKAARYTARKKLNDRRKDMKILFEKYTKARTLLKVHPLDVTCENEEVVRD